MLFIFTRTWGLFHLCMKNLGVTRLLITSEFPFLGTPTDESIPSSAVVGIFVIVFILCGGWADNHRVYKLMCSTVITCPEKSISQYSSISFGTTACMFPEYEEERLTWLSHLCLSTYSHLLLVSINNGSLH